MCANTGNICYSAFHNSRDREDYLCPADMMNETYLPVIVTTTAGSGSLVVLGFSLERFSFTDPRRGKSKEKRRRKTDGAFVANPNVNGNTSVGR